MAKYNLRVQARELRKKGVSVKSIAEQLEVSKSTASIWVRDIILTVEQLEKLRFSELKGKELGRLKGALFQKERKAKQIKISKDEGLRTLAGLTKREVLIAGLALYWGEGSKKDRRVQFCNSDPDMIKFILYWLQEYFQVDRKDIRCTVGINEAHSHRENIVKQYWSKLTNIPEDQFYRTSFKKVASKKVYDNRDQHYGTLSINVCKSTRYSYTLLGLIDAMSELCVVSSDRMPG